MPYFQPVYGTRFGLKVSKLYDNGNQDWLSMYGHPKEWAIAFHGIGLPHGKPTGKPSHIKTILQSIMSGRKSGTML